VLGASPGELPPHGASPAVPAASQPPGCVSSSSSRRRCLGRPSHPSALLSQIVSRLGNKWNYAAVKNALNFLSNEGHAFSTTDEVCDEPRCSACMPWGCVCVWGGGGGGWGPARGGAAVRRRMRLRRVLTRCRCRCRTTTRPPCSWARTRVHMQRTASLQRAVRKLLGGDSSGGGDAGGRSAHGEAARPASEGQPSVNSRSKGRGSVPTRDQVPFM